MTLRRLLDEILYLVKYRSHGHRVVIILSQYLLLKQNEMLNLVCLFAYQSVLLLELVVFLGIYFLWIL